jgi:maltooligosyltrehalose trehalohydrolase
MSNVEIEAGPAGRPSRAASGASWRPGVGANLEAGAVRFRVWAPAAREVKVVIHYAHETESHTTQREADGHHVALVSGIGPGTRYKFRIDGSEYPDPASRSQPEGVHGPSEIVDPQAFRWSDAGWAGLTPDGLVIYELHVGTFTADGTFDAAIERLDDLRDLGVNAIEVMPIATFPGERNWGYDGVGLYAPAAPYGGPEAFKRFVDAAHARGLGVILDVVYNHFGPEGNYLPAITGGRFFTDRHRTPWGDAIAYDGPDSGPVREFVIQNALYWAHEFHVDGLRLDATHAILDDSPRHVLREIAERLHQLSRPRIVIAEDERNERRVLLPGEDGGLGIDAVWADDLHHQLRRLTAGDSEGYFASYSGAIEDVVTTLEKGWFYEGQRAEHFGKPRGTPAEGLPPRAFVHCIQNHDQTGNRPLGDRITESVSLPVYRALSALLLVSPYTPMLWMGQEWAASSPFQYFTDHPEELGKLVTEGRREEFKSFSAFSDPARREAIPDPQAESTFLRSKLKWEERDDAPHRGTLALYRELLRLRAGDPALRPSGREGFAVATLGERALVVRRAAGSSVLLAVVSFADALQLDFAARAETRAPAGGRWSVLLDTEEERFGGGGPARLTSDGAALELRAAGAVLLVTGRQG